MIPLDIGPHPDAPEYYIAMGKPASMTDADCGTLMVRIVGHTPDTVQDVAIRIVSVPFEQAVIPGFMSEWYPEPEEMARLVAGLPIRLLVSGTSLPPVAMWVRGDGEQ